MPPDRQEEILALVRENNTLLKKMHRNAVVEMWLRVLWYALIIGLPFLLYFYILEPYLGAIKDQLDQYGVGVGAYPGLEKIESLLHRGE